MGNQLKHDIREYMRTHPGVKYTEARNIVLAGQKPPSQESSSGVSLLDALGDTSPSSIAAVWKETEFDGSLRIPIGFDVNDQHLIDLDLGEYFAGGHGPHGCVQGTTGTGKTVLAWNTVLALAARNSPTKLNIAIGDGKGDWLTNRVAGLPHVVKRCAHTDSEENLAELVAFVEEEMHRREELLDEHRVPNIQHYTALRARGQGGAPLPRLLVIAEEFSETLGDRSNGLGGALGNITRKGRSLGVHLLLSNLVVEGYQLAQIMPNLSYRLSLKVNSASSSHNLLGTGDAASLPIGKGDALLRTDDGAGTDQITPLRVLQLESNYNAARDDLVARIVATSAKYLT